MTMKHPCEHWEYRWTGPLWSLQRISWPSSLPGVVAALRYSQSTHLNPLLRIRACLECDQLTLNGGQAVGAAVVPSAAAFVVSQRRTLDLKGRRP